MTWDEVSTAWASLWTQVESGWRSLYDEAVRTWEAAIRQDPDAYAPKVEAWVAELNAARADLDRIKALLPQPAVTDADRATIARYEGLERRYHELAAAFYADTQPLVAQGSAAAPALGFVPILIAAGLAVGVGATSWAVAAYEYAANLREQTALATRELEARVQASEEGRTLQPTTLPAAPEPELPVSGPGRKAVLVLGGLAAVTAALTLPLLLKRS